MGTAWKLRAFLRVSGAQLIKYLSEFAPKHVLNKRLEKNKTLLQVQYAFSRKCCSFIVNETKESERARIVMLFVYFLLTFDLSFM
jgi:hypothetical protein